MQGGRNTYLRLDILYEVGNFCKQFQSKNLRGFHRIEIALACMDDL